MAFNKAPTATLPSYAYSSGTISISENDLDNILPEDLDPSTGDIRKILHKLLNTVYTEWKALASVDKPTQFTIALVKKMIGDNEVWTYTVQSVTTGVTDVVAEP